MGGGPKGDDRTCNGNPQIYLSISHIYCLFKLTVSLSSSLLYRLIPNDYFFIACLYFYCNNHSLATLNWWQKSKWASLHFVGEKIGKEEIFFWPFVFKGCREI